jgi:hypothetical protein
MMQRLRKTSGPAKAAISTKRKPSAARVADAASAAAPSPALALQQRLASGWNEATEADDGRRWAPRSTLMLAAGVSLLAWGALAWVAFSAL